MALIKTAVTLPQDDLDLLDKLADTPGTFQERSRAWLIRYAIEKTFGEYRETDVESKPDEKTK